MELHRVRRADWRRLASECIHLFPAARGSRRTWVLTTPCPSAVATRVEIGGQVCRYRGSSSGASRAEAHISHRFETCAPV